jgi:acetyl esterase/lipase
MRPIMARRLLQIVPTPEQILALARQELSRALLEDMQARERDPIGGKALRNSLGPAVVTSANFDSSRQNPRELQTQLDRAGNDAYALLEQWGLIEADQGINGRNG